MNQLGSGSATRRATMAGTYAAEQT